MLDERILGVDGMKVALLLVLTHLTTFAVGVSVKCFADWFTDRRRQREAEGRLRNLFVATASRMPALIKEMQKDLSVPANSIMREFFILPREGIRMRTGGRKYLFYYEDQHDNLMHKIGLLEEAGFVSDITQTSTPKYRMSERFATFVIEAPHVWDGKK